MKKIGIITTSLLLICSISYAGYVTIEEEKIIIGDATRVIGKLPMQKRVEVVGKTKNRYIIKHNSHLAGIEKKCLRFPKDEQPYIYLYVGVSEQIYEVTLELYKGEEYKVIKEDKTRYLIEYTFKDTPIEVWIEKNLVSYKKFSRLEEEQIAMGLVKYEDKWITPDEKYELEQEAKGLVKYQDKWITPDEKFELEQKAKGLIKYEGRWLTYEQVQEAKGLVKYQDKWVTPDEKFELEQEAKGLIKYQGKWLTYDQVQEAKGLVKYQDKWVTPGEKFELEQQAKGLIKYQDKWLTYDQVQEAKGLVKYRDKWVTPDEKFGLEQKAKGLVKYQDKWVTPDEKFELEQKAKGLVKYRNEWFTLEKKLELEQQWKNALLNICKFALLFIIIVSFFIWFIAYLKKKHIMNKIWELFRFIYYDWRSKCSVIWLFFIMLFIILFIIYIIQGFITGFESPPKQYFERCRDCGARTYGGDMYCGQCLKAEGDRMEAAARAEYLREHRW